MKRRSIRNNEMIKRKEEEKLNKMTDEEKDEG